jgi:hypothetical protein
MTTPNPARDQQRLLSAIEREDRRRRSVEKRMTADTTDSRAAPLEFLYQDSTDREHDRRYSNRHRIVKRTVKRVFVERRPYEFTLLRAERIADGTDTWYDHDVETFSLDRARLEADGEACSGSRWGRVWFYATPYEERAQKTTPSGLVEPLAVLGLSWPCTVDDVKRAYRRLARKTHPDHGGDAEAFRNLTTAYEQLLSIFSHEAQP